ncbi:putative quinone oxidoreductase [Talaromyces proteolyticus]|uniref:alcohol dehydrogenase (NADP(+)) n=1 Tax=Talaromyces proteolyticus TaxID=1131652 RepID=A0AAD4KZ38_9EURO|nr:putative quinone oxidoreductase [Talaromyces proteolyticus]KAH8703274.1 putative quinone oxidoreductase [Talaromyces proteolyticus]
MTQANGTEYTFQGWMGLDKGSIGNLKWQTYEPKAWEETDVDIKVTHCGICGSDLHTLRSGWGATAYPCVVGHEIVGIAVRVGSEVKHVKVGDRVGVGAQSDSCLNRSGKCPDCSAGRENLCFNKGRCDTYNSVFLNGGKSYGGYADYNRTPGHFVIKIPDGLSSAAAAPMLCGGITTYAPLKNNGCGPGKRVAIIGVGGLGHFGILWAKALGADRVVGISRKESKRTDVLKLGADDYIATSEQKNWAQEHSGSFDLIISTVSSPNMPLRDYMRLLDSNGILVQVGAPEDKLPDLLAFDFIMKGKSLSGSLIGPPAQIEEMLQFAVEKNVQPWIEERPLTEANQAIVDMENGLARYRYTLVNEKNL